MGLYYLYIQDLDYHPGKKLLYGDTHERYKGNNWYKPGASFKDILCNHKCEKILFFPIENYKKIKIIHENPITHREESDILRGENLTLIDLVLKSVFYYKNLGQYSEHEYYGLHLMGWDFTHSKEGELICYPFIFE